jgi:DDE superfamily endonuclease
LVLDGAPNHRCGDLVLPDNISLLFLPPYGPELNLKENLWDEIREKIFKTYVLKSIDAVRAKLKEAILYMERKPEIVKSIPHSPTFSSHSDVEMVLLRRRPSLACMSDNFPAAKPVFSAMRPSRTHGTIHVLIFRQRHADDS